MKIVYRNIRELKPYKKNAKKHPREQIEQIAESIKMFGFTQPVLIDSNNCVVAGHGRILGAKKAGLKQVPTVKLEQLTEEQIKAYRLVDNKLNESPWDVDLLDAELETLTEDIDMSLFGFDLDMSDEEEKVTVVEDDYNENKEAQRVCNYGDFYRLGENALLCYDNTKTQDIFNILKHKGDVLILDPPFDLKGYDYIKALQYVKSGNPIFLFASDKQTSEIACKIPNFRQFIVHDRVIPVLVSVNIPMSQHTIISLFCEKPSRFFNNLKDGFSSIIRCPKQYNKSYEQNYSKMGKPVTVMSEIITHYSKERDLIVDIFGGGGSTLIACEQTNRKCFIIEKDEKQCDKILERYKLFTGKEAKLIKNILTQ